MLQYLLKSHRFQIMHYSPYHNYYKLDDKPVSPSLAISLRYAVVLIAKSSDDRWYVLEVSGHCAVISYMLFDFSLSGVCLELNAKNELFRSLLRKLWQYTLRIAKKVCFGHCGRAVGFWSLRAFLEGAWTGEASAVRIRLVTLDHWASTYILNWSAQSVDQY